MVSICNLVLYILIQRSLVVADSCGCRRNQGFYATVARVDDESPISYQVGIYGRDLYNKICGGAIISCSWIITAAQCIKKSGGEELTIVAGSTTRPGPSKTGYGTHAIVRSGSIGARIMHPDNNGNVKDNDIALVELTCAIPFSEHIKPVALPESALDGSTDFLVSGWGLTYNPNLLDVPVAVNLIDVKRANCDQKEFDEEGKFFCAIGANGNSSEAVECYGDAGGPAVASVSGDIMRLAGITSFFGYTTGQFVRSNACARTTAAQVKYVNVAKHVQWIMNTTGNLQEREVCKTVYNRVKYGPCKFPFTYKNKSYDSCTKFDSTSPWCAVQVHPDGRMKANQWAWCVSCKAGRVGKNVCKCDGGIPASGTNCTEPGAEICASCSTGYYKEGQRCKRGNALGKPCGNFIFPALIPDPTPYDYGLCAPNLTCTFDGLDAPWRCRQTVLPVVDCVLGAVPDATQCTAQCGTLTQKIETPASGGGKECGPPATHDCEANEGACGGSNKLDVEHRGHSETPRSGKTNLRPQKIYTEQ